MSTITFINENKTVHAEKGENLLILMRRAGFEPDAPCGGNGKCGKCKVTLGDGSTVLACQTKIEGDLTITDIHGTPQDAQILMDASIPEGKTATVTETEAGNEASEEAPSTGPMLEERKVFVRPCPNGESISDWTRFAEGVGKNVRVNPYVSSKVGRMARGNKGTVYAVLFGGEVMDVFPESRDLYAAAFDIGTTTVAGYLLRLIKAGEEETEKKTEPVVVTTDSCMNPQAQYGADVINRANYALENGMEEITACIHAAIQRLIESMAKKAGISTEDIYLISVAGNTCMHHLFLGIDVDSLVHAPYNPSVSDPMILRTSDYELSIHPAGRLLMLPNIAGFVGADTVACLVATGLAEQDDWTLLIDIGTNGEMVLGRRHNMAACSTAAGPSFEGAGISCGMRGSAGAISKVVWAEDHWECGVIGDGKARGICGSGLLDLAAELLRSGQMDEYGELDESPIVLADEEHGENGKPVTFEQKDVRQLQLAKAAIASGVHLLAKKQGIELDEIKTVWLAGAFGSFLSPVSACRIGLIPEELDGRISAVGNAAGEGAKLVLMDARMWRYARQLSSEAGFLELAAMPEFQDRFVDELMFPE
ncbi:MAG: DUF4445 domain-containing protein [Lachnospiraceae bacterium]|nr:DUF4445 domain-containing protein [Lachnospiraceae bacterium]